MVNENINFIGAQTLKRINLAKQAKLVALGMAVLFGLIAIATCAVTIVIVSQKLTVKKIDKLKAEKEKEINNYIQIESMMYTISSRAKILKELGVNGKNNMLTKLELVDRLLAINFKPKGDIRLGQITKIEVEGIVPSVNELANISILLDDLKNQEYMTDYQIDTIKRNSDGSYLLSVNIILESSK